MISTNLKVDNENNCQTYGHSEILAKWVVRKRNPFAIIRVCNDCFRSMVGSDEDVEVAESVEEYRKKERKKERENRNENMHQNIVWARRVLGIFV